MSEHGPTLTQTRKLLLHPAALLPPFSLKHATTAARGVRRYHRSPIPCALEKAALCPTPNHRIIQVGKDLQHPQVQPQPIPPCPLTTSLRATSPSFLNTSRDSDPTAPPGQLCHAPNIQPESPLVQLKANPPKRSHQMDVNQHQSFSHI